MIFSIGSLVVILAITFRQATSGMFSALLMTMLTICCAILAFAVQGWVATNLIGAYWNPDYGMALGLAAPFGILLIVLRLLTDHFITRSCLLPSMIDRAGGAVCGFVTAMTIVGIAALSLQMMPLGRTTLGFQRVPTYVQPPDGGSLPPLDVSDSNLILSPDRFAAGLASFASSGVFSGERSFYRDYPDLPGSVSRATAVPAGVSIYAPPDSISIKQTSKVDFVYKMKLGNERESTPDEFTPIEPSRGHEFRVVRVKIGSTAARDRIINFTLRQFQMVGEESGGTPAVLYASAIQQPKDDATNRHIRFIVERGGDRPVYDDVFIPREGTEVEVVFEVPIGFKPHYLTYKLGARTPVKFDDAPPPAPAETEGGSNPETAPTNLHTDAVSASPKRVVRTAMAAQSGAGQLLQKRGGNVRNVTSRTELSFFGDKMPMELKSYRSEQNPELGRDSIKSGHFYGKTQEQEQGTDPPVKKFWVPEDKRLLQLNTEYLPTKSTLGKAMARAVEVAGNYTVTDDHGAVYKIIGKYAIADVNGTEWIEIEYYPEQAGTIGGVGEFKKIKNQYLKGNYTLVYLFLVDPGVTITRFSTGGSANRADDLRSAKLVAPK